MEFFQNAGQFLGNYAKATADLGLGALGASNVITDDNYKGDNASKWDNVANVGGKIGGVGLQVAGNIVAPGIGGQIVGGAQQVGAGLNPLDPNDQIQQQPMQAQQPYYNAMPPMANAAQMYANGGYVRGKLKGYNGKNGENYVWGNGGNFTGYNPNANIGNNGYPMQTDSTVNGNSATPNPFASEQSIPLEGYQFSNNTSSVALPNTASATGINPYIAGGTAALGLGQTAIALYQLNKLKREKMPTIGISPQLQSAYNSSQEMAKRGYTGQEEGAFKNNLAINNNTTYKNAVNQSGGNLAQAINAGLQSQNINALNQFAANDASLKRDNQRYANTFANEFQGIQNENERNALKYRLMREQALGTAASQGLTNLATATNAAMQSKYKG